MRIALKELSFATAPSAQAIDAFEREGKLLETLIHPRIPRFVKAFASGEGIHLRLYLAQEYIPGQPLTARLQTGALPESEVVLLLRSVLEILQYLHERQPRVIHRDVKPSNIMCRLDGEIALIDFGAARTLGQTMMDATLVGTFGYMPPQQLAGQVDETTDLYALGATAMHLLSGRPPWELMSEELQLELPPNANVSPSLALFLRHMTAPQRRNRIQTAREALQLLDGTFRATG
jgi:serine/threonine-protein kinase